MSDSKNKIPRIYLGIMIGPEKSGKTSFSKIAYKHFNLYYPNFAMTLLVYDHCPPKDTFYQLKSYIITSIDEMRRIQAQKPYFRRVIIVDARNMDDSKIRHDIFQFCLKFNIIYLQIYMQFDPNELISRCARRGLFISPLMLCKPEYLNVSAIGADPSTQWQNNSITILKTFKTTGEFQVTRLYNFLLNIIQSESYIVPKASLKYDNPHQLQMQAGISYKDKLIGGKVKTSYEKKRKPRKSNK